MNSGTAWNNKFIFMNGWIDRKNYHVTPHEIMKSAAS